MKKAIMYGAGNIGRGFIGQLLSQSGYEVVFIDVNKEIVAALNHECAYPICIITSAGIVETVVANVRAVDGLDIEAVAEEIANADIMATAVGVNVLPGIARPIAAGLQRRWARKNTLPLNIMICENLIDANHYLAQLIREELTKEEAPRFDSLIGMVEASIGRMVPIMTDDMRKGNILRVCVEEYGELPVDKDAFAGPIPSIKNMVPYSPFAYYIHRKLFIHNLGHAVTAYLGSLLGYSFIWEAVNDPRIKLVGRDAMLEAAMALSLEHHVHPVAIIGHINNLIFRFGNKQLGDTVERVGKDPLRKLSSHDRLAGALHLCRKHHVAPVAISLGIAAAFCFNNQNDSAFRRLADQVEHQGFERTLSDLCGISPGSPEFEYITRFHSIITEQHPFDSIVHEMEVIRDHAAKEPPV